MKIFKLSLIFFIASVFITACNRSQIEDSIRGDYELGRVEAAYGDVDDRWAREDLDLQAVGELLPQADDAAELEYLLNNEDGVNNLDLNGDGYADYISVREFDDRDDDERGFSLYSMFGPDEIQEILTIIFDRRGYNDGYYPGARVLLTGNENIYGDNYYYESNWMDRPLPIVNWLFTDRDDYYRSPYYYGYYPDYYQPYSVVETTVYQTRIDEYYPSPVFIQTSQPSITQVKIVSPYHEKTMTKIYSKMAKPTKQQVEFERSNPNLKEVVRVNRERSKSFAVKEDRKSDKQFEKQFKNNQNRFERPEQREKPNKQEWREKPNKREDVRPQNKVKFEKQNWERKAERQNQPRFEKPQRVERPQQPRFEKPQQPRFERPQPQQQQPRPQMKPQKQDNPGGGGGNPNKGGGNPNKGGGNGNGGGGGGKKGKG